LRPKRAFLALPSRPPVHRAMKSETYSFLRLFFCHRRLSTLAGQPFRLAPKICSQGPKTSTSPRPEPSTRAQAEGDRPKSSAESSSRVSVIATTTPRPICLKTSTLQCLAFQMGVAIVPSAPLRTGLVGWVQGHDPKIRNRKQLVTIRATRPHGFVVY
jgi:hypothetical protein